MRQGNKYANGRPFEERNRFSKSDSIHHATPKENP